VDSISCTLKNARERQLSEENKKTQTKGMQCWYIDPADVELGSGGVQEADAEAVAGLLAPLVRLHDAEEVKGRGVREIGRVNPGSGSDDLHLMRMHVRD
jgi:hypothetical protein